MEAGHVFKLDRSNNRWTHATKANDPRSYQEDKASQERGVRTWRNKLETCGPEHIIRTTGRSTLNAEKGSTSAAAKSEMKHCRKWTHDINWRRVTVRKNLVYRAQMRIASQIYRSGEAIALTDIFIFKKPSPKETSSSWLTESLIDQLTTK